MRRDAQRLADIVQAAEIAQAYIDGVTREQFFAGGLLQDAVLRQLTILGEAAFKTSVELQQRHPTIPWSKIVGFRHRLVHDYFGLDLDAVWQIASSELPILKREISGILAEEQVSERNE